MLKTSFCHCISVAYHNSVIEHPLTTQQRQVFLGDNYWLKWNTGSCTLTGWLTLRFASFLVFFLCFCSTSTSATCKAIFWINLDNLNLHLHQLAVRKAKAAFGVFVNQPSLLQLTFFSFCHSNYWEDKFPFWPSYLYEQVGALITARWLVFSQTQTQVFALSVWVSSRRTMRHTKDVFCLGGSQALNEAEVTGGG